MVSPSPRCRGGDTAWDRDQSSVSPALSRPRWTLIQPSISPLDQTIQTAFLCFYGYNSPRTRYSFLKTAAEVLFLRFTTLSGPSHVLLQCLWVGNWDYYLEYGWLESPDLCRWATIVHSSVRHFVECVGAVGFVSDRCWGWCVWVRSDNIINYPVKSANRNLFPVQHQIRADL